MTKEQQKFLFERLHTVTWGALPAPKDPPGIQKLRAALNRYDAKVSRVMKERIDRRSAAGKTVREIIFAGDYNKALAAVKAFEQQVF